MFHNHSNRIAPEILELFLVMGLFKDFSCIFCILIVLVLIFIMQLSLNQTHSNYIKYLNTLINYHANSPKTTDLIHEHLLVFSHPNVGRPALVVVQLGHDFSVINIHLEVHLTDRQSWILKIST